MTAKAPQDSDDAHGKRPKKRPTLLLTEGDLEVFHWLWQLRILTLGQIRRLRYYQPETGRLSALDNARKRLHRLEDAGYLRGDIFVPTKEKLFSLEDSALPELQDRYGITQRRLYRPRNQDSLKELRHPLLVSELAVRMVESLRGTGIVLENLEPLGVPFVHTHAIADAKEKRHVERFVSQVDLPTSAGASGVARIRPDLVFGLSYRNDSRLYFLEADRGSEGTVEIEEKLRAYAEYVTAFDPDRPTELLWRRYGGFGVFRVLFVTISEQRVKSLMKALAGKPGFELCFFTSVSAVKERNMVTGEVWSGASGLGKPLVKVDF